MTDTRASTSAVTAPEVRAMLQGPGETLVVDVRTPGEFESAHIPGAINIPLDQVDSHLRRIVSEAGGRMVLVCLSGGRAQMAAGKLAGAGLDDVVVLEGGMNSWLAAGGEVERTGKARWGLERQVRLVAGSVVLISVLLSLVWQPAVFLAGFIGAGLTFSGITNTCGMAMMLAKLPYNRGAACDIDAAIARLSR